MPDYSQGKIYKIISKNTDKIYIGGTTNKLSKRLSNHKNRYNNYVLFNGKKYISSFEIIKHGDSQIVLLCDFPCSTKTELTTKEGEYIRELDCVNIRYEGRTHKEYYQDNKQKIIDKVKKHYRQNKESINKYRNEKIKCTLCNCNISRRNVARHNKTLKHLQRKKSFEIIS